MKAVSYNQRNTGHSKTLCLGTSRALWNHGELFSVCSLKKNMCFRSEIKRLNVVFLPPRIYALKFFLQNCLLLSQASLVQNLLSPGSFLPVRRMGAGCRECGLWKWWPWARTPIPPKLHELQGNHSLSESWFLICTKGFFRSGSTHQLCDLE